MTEPKGTSAAAVDWFLRLQHADDEQVFLDHLAWLQVDSRHADAYAEVERVWVDAEALPPASPSTGVGEVASLADRRVERARRRLWMPLAGAAAAAAVVVGSLALDLPGGRGAAPRTFATDATHTLAVTLADGSIIRLNRSTALTVHIARDERTAELASGEAIFDIHHEDARPFAVAAAGREVRVLGTAFDVLSQDGAFRVAVARGAVSVSPRTGEGAALRLPAGKVLWQNNATGGDTIRAIDAADALAWGEGRLVYDDAPIAIMAQDLARYTGKPVGVDPGLRDLRVTGTLDLGDVARLDRQVEALLPIAVRLAPGGGLRLQPAA